MSARDSHRAEVTQRLIEALAASSTGFHSSQLEAILPILDAERKRWIGEVKSKIKPLRRDEHPTEDGIPVETYGYEETYNEALDAVSNVLNEMEIKK